MAVDYVTQSYEKQRNDKSNPAALAEFFKYCYQKNGQTKDEPYQVDAEMPLPFRLSRSFFYKKPRHPKLRQ